MVTPRTGTQIYAIFLYDYTTLYNYDEKYFITHIFFVKGTKCV